MREVATVISAGLNLHGSARQGSKIIDQLTTGDELTIDGHSGIWLHGKVTKTRSGRGLGQVGWVSSKFVNLQSYLDLPPVTPPPVIVQDPPSSFAINYYGLATVLVLAALSALAWWFG